MKEEKKGPALHNSLHTRVIQRMQLQNIDKKKNHYKFYRVDVGYNKKRDKYIVDTTWGRIGAKGQHQVKAEGDVLDEVLNEMERVLLQKLFKRGYEITDIKRWPNEARAEDQDRYINEDWD